ncbi:hypothetical protein AYK26_02165 [Euryarchaeota archaeon SM23-78]|nr:MAG: hypothetical protein AYK26_02165 [Euryarchaeota archaeon SM23-78]MBW3000347.1 hypothetical protein [Candidatus Woesearchaeota archaeon]
MNETVNRGSLYFEKKKIKWVLLVLLVSIGAFLVSKSFFFISLFLLISIFFYMLISRLRFSVGLEFVTISTILIGAAYGPFAGILMGVVGRLIEAFSTRRLFSLPVTLPLYALLGYFAGVYAGTNIVLFGIVLSVLYAIASGVLTFLLLGGRLRKVMTFLIIEVIINVLFFINIAPFMLNVMK